VTRVGLAAIGGAGLVWGAWVLLVRGRLVPRRPNHRGRSVPTGVGLSLAFAVVAAAAARMVAGGSGATPVEVTAGWSLLALAAAGFVDDRVVGGPRGLPGHVRSLLRGRMTSGILKLVVAIAAAAWVAATARPDPLGFGLALVVLAAATNVWNAFDVRPGRALKWSLCALVPMLVASWGETFSFLAAAMIGGCLVLLVPDLRERTMLGDAGSNPLGFAVGLGLVSTLDLLGLAVAAVLLLALQVVAETVTISRVIERVPPLRWFDRLGRLPR